MSASPKVLTVALAILCAACEPKPPHWADVCVESKEVERWVPKMAAPGHFGPGPLRLVTSQECIRTERRCVVDPEWRGDQRCS